MELVNRTYRRVSPFLARLAMLLLAVSACVSCGPSVIEGRPPFIGISGMRLVDDELNADFRVSNQNDVPMNIEAIDINVTVSGAELVSENSQLKLTVDANSAEEVHVERLPEAFTRDLLSSLENREVKSLPFSLTGRVLTVEDGYLRFEQKGHLYPVPGKPGYFRSAVTQAEELRREENL